MIFDKKTGNKTKDDGGRRRMGGGEGSSRMCIVDLGRKNDENKENPLSQGLFCWLVCWFLFFLCVCVCVCVCAKDGYIIAPLAYSRVVLLLFFCCRHRSAGVCVCVKKMGDERVSRLLIKAVGV